jgi:4-hydroxybenzoate polyprenyltransferase
VTEAGRALLLAFCPLFAALYPLTQLYQLEDDRARGDRTMALVLGVRTSLSVALAATLVAFAILSIAGWRAGWGDAGDAATRWVGLGVAAVAWVLVLVPWHARAERCSPRDHQRWMYRALGAWAVTDVAVLYGFAR